VKKLKIEEIGLNLTSKYGLKSTIDFMNKFAIKIGI